jgi:hypothetical protein
MSHEIIRERLLLDIAKHRLRLKKLPAKTLVNVSDMAGFKVCEEAPKYAVNEKGEVKRIRDGFTMSPSFDKDGYPRVSLVAKSGYRTFRIHRLVATAFVSNPEGKSHVNHVDGVKTNCAASNLEWVTAGENYRHATATLKVGMHKFTVDDILLAKLQMMINLMEELKRRDDCTRPMEEKINRTLRKLRE